MIRGCDGKRVTSKQYAAERAFFALVHACDTLEESTHEDDGLTKRERARVLAHLRAERSRLLSASLGPAPRN